MAVVITKEIRKKRILIAAFAVLVLLSLSILYFGGVIGGGSQAPSVEPSQEIPVATGSGEVKIPISDAKLKILEDERFKILQSPPGVPVKTDTTGKANPFSD